MPGIIAGRGNLVRIGTIRMLLIILNLGTWIGRASARAETDPPVTAVAFSFDGESVVTGSQSGINVWNWPRLDVSRRIPCPLLHIHDVLFASNGNEFVAVGGSPASSGELIRVGFSSGEVLHRVQLGEDVLYSVCWCKEGDTALAIAGGDGSVYWSEQGDREFLTMTGHAQPALTLCSIGGHTILVSGGIDHSLRVWDLHSHKLLRSMNNHTAPVLDLASRPGSGMAVHPYVVSVSEDRTVRLWQPTLGRMVRFARLDAVPNCVDWTHDGSHIVVGCRDGTVRMIDPDSVEVVQCTQILKGWVYAIDAHPALNEVVVGGSLGAVRRVVLEVQR